MAKLKEYPKAKVFDSGDILIKDGMNGTQQIAVEDAFSAYLDETLSEPGKFAPADKVGRIKALIEDLEQSFTQTTAIDPNSSAYKMWISTRTNVWGSGSRYECGIVAIADNSESIKITANAESYTLVAILSSQDHTAGKSPDYANGWNQTVLLSAGETRAFDIPEDGRYLFYSKKYDGLNCAPQSITYSKLFDLNDAAEFKQIPLGLHEMPRNETALNIVKRCRQLTDIKWTPAVDLPRYMLVQRGGGDIPIPETASGQNFMGTFKAGVTYTGAPYGRELCSVPVQY